MSWNDYLQQYVAVYNSPLSENVMMRTAPSAEGRWSREVMAFTALKPAPGKVHPEHNVNGGQTMFVTYSHASGEFTSETRLVSVQLSKAKSQ